MDESTRDDIRKARGGDRQALERLLRRFEIPLASVARARLGPGLRAHLHPSDVLQSTYLELMKGVKDFPGASSNEFVAWAVRVMENTIRDKAKYFRAEKRAGTESLEEATARGATPGANGATPSEIAIGVEDVLLVSRALELLEPDHRDILRFRYVHDLPHEEIAGRLGRTPAACRTLFTRAKAVLLVKIEELRGRPDVR